MPATDSFEKFVTDNWLWLNRTRPVLPGIPPDPCETVLKILRRVQIRDFPARIELQFNRRPEAPGCVSAAIQMGVHDRSTGMPSQIGSSWRIDCEQYADAVGERRLLLELRDRLQELLTHELDECIYVDGERIFDPHEAQRARPFVRL